MPLFLNKKAPIFINDNSDASMTIGIDAFPTLAVHFPPTAEHSNSKLITVYPGKSAQEIWDNINDLLLLGRLFKGSFGKLVRDETCNEGGPRIDS